MNNTDFIQLMAKLDSIERNVQSLKEENEKLKEENKKLMEELINVYKTSQPRK